MTLDCTRDTLATLEPFAEEHYINSNPSDYEPFYAVDPFAEFEAEHVPLVTEHIPPSELALQRGALVVASDGPAGELTAFVVEGVSGAISSISYGWAIGSPSTNGRYRSRPLSGSTAAPST